VKKFFRAVSNMRMPRARLPVVWDAKELLDSLEGPLKSLTLLDLSCRPAVLLAITTAQRVQTLAALSLQATVITQRFALFCLSDPQKTSNPRRLPHVDIKAFENERLCPLLCLRTCLQRTSALRAENCDAVFVSTRALHCAASRDSVARWIRRALQQAGSAWEYRCLHRSSFNEGRLE
jgi:hypothetical protein